VCRQKPIVPATIAFVNDEFARRELLPLSTHSFMPVLLPHDKLLAVRIAIRLFGIGPGKTPALDARKCFLSQNASVIEACCCSLRDSAHCENVQGLLFTKIHSALDEHFPEPGA
jgi:hypothetical protein